MQTHSGVAARKPTPHMAYAGTSFHSSHNHNYNYNSGNKEPLGLPAAVSVPGPGPGHGHGHAPMSLSMKVPRFNSMVMFRRYKRYPKHAIISMGMGMGMMGMGVGEEQLRYRQPPPPPPPPPAAMSRFIPKYSPLYIGLGGYNGMGGGHSPPAPYHAAPFKSYAHLLRALNASQQKQLQQTKLLVKMSTTTTRPTTAPSVSFESTSTFSPLLVYSERKNKPFHMTTLTSTQTATTPTSSTANLLSHLSNPASAQCSFQDLASNDCNQLKPAQLVPSHAPEYLHFHYSTPPASHGGHRETLSSSLSPFRPPFAIDGEAAPPGPFESDNALNAIHFLPTPYSFHQKSHSFFTIDDAIVPSAASAPLRSVQHPQPLRYFQPEQQNVRSATPTFYTSTRPTTMSWTPWAPWTSTTTAPPVTPPPVTPPTVTPPPATPPLEEATQSYRAPKSEHQRHRGGQSMLANFLNGLHDELTHWPSHNQNLVDTTSTTAATITSTSAVVTPLFSPTVESETPAVQQKSKSLSTRPKASADEPQRWSSKSKRLLGDLSTTPALVSTSMPPAAKSVSEDEAQSATTAVPATTTTLRSARSKPPSEAPSTRTTNDYVPLRKYKPKIKNYSNYLNYMANKAAAGAATSSTRAAPLHELRSHRFGGIKPSSSEGDAGPPSLSYNINNRTKMVKFKPIGKHLKMRKSFKDLTSSSAPITTPTTTMSTTTTTTRTTVLPTGPLSGAQWSSSGAEKQQTLPTQGRGGKRGKASRRVQPTTSSTAPTTAATTKSTTTTFSANHGHATTTTTIKPLTALRSSINNIVSETSTLATWRSKRKQRRRSTQQPPAAGTVALRPRSRGEDLSRRRRKQQRSDDNGIAEGSRGALSVPKNRGVVNSTTARVATTANALTVSGRIVEVPTHPASTAASSSSTTTTSTSRSSSTVESAIMKIKSSNSNSLGRHTLAEPTTPTSTTIDKTKLLQGILQQPQASSSSSPLDQLKLTHLSSTTVPQLPIEVYFRKLKTV